MNTGIGRTVAAAAVAVILVLPVASASAARSAPRVVSHAINFQTASQTVICGITPRVHGTRFDPGTGTDRTGNWAGLQCSARGIGPKHPTEGDPFVQLGQGAAGRARLVEIGDDDLASDAAPATLAAGSSWSRNGITCTVAAASVSCHNSSGHGFALSQGHLRTH